MTYTTEIHEGIHAETMMMPAWRWPC